MKPETCRAEHEFLKNRNEQRTHGVYYKVQALRALLKEHFF